MRSAREHCKCSGKVRGKGRAESAIMETFGFGSIGIAAVVLAVVAGIGERRRNARRNLDAVGFMPWSAITLFSVMVALIAFSLAIKGY